MTKTVIRGMGSAHAKAFSSCLTYLSEQHVLVHNQTNFKSFSCLSTFLPQFYNFHRRISHQIQVSLSYEFPLADYFPVTKSITQREVVGRTILTLTGVNLHIFCAPILGFLKILLDIWTKTKYKV